MYQESVEKFGLPILGRTLERPFRENLIDTYIKVVKNSPAHVSGYLKIYIQRFEVENLKALIKAANAEMDTEQKLSRIYFSVEDFLKNRAAFEEAAKAPDMKQLVAAMKKTEYAEALGQGLRSFEENGATTCFDLLIDKAFYEKLYSEYQHLPRRERRHARYYAETEDTSYILTSLLRAKALGFDANWLRVTIPDDHFLAKENVEALVTAADFDTAFSLVQKTGYGKFFAKAPTPEEAVANAEKAFRQALFVHALKSRIPETFNVGLPLAFMYHKEAEVRNLAAISLGVEVGLASDEIQKTLQLPSR